MSLSTEFILDPWPAPRAASPVDVTVALPGSKSLTNRALLLAAIADGPSTVHRALRSRDTLLMAGALTSLGCSVDTSGDDWHVIPFPADLFPADAVPGVPEPVERAVDCGLAGTVMRFVPPVAALAAGSTSFDGDAHMRNRPVGAMLAGLRDLGVTVDDGGRGALPFTVRGDGTVRGGHVVIDASASSQFVSALLLAGARYEQGVDVEHRGSPVPSLPHIEMTVELLRSHGVRVDDSVKDRWTVAPGTVTAKDHFVEPDLSNAAPFLALAAVSGGRVVVKDWPRRTTQAGDTLREVLTAMGCEVSFVDEGLEVRGTGRLQGVDLDLHDHGELAPAIAALCALAETPSRLTGIAHIRGHETDRLAALATELNRLGSDVDEHPDGLTIRPAALHGGLFHTYADHRMAHAGVILAAAVDGVLVENVETTSKTFPDFAPFWAGLF